MPSIFEDFKEIQKCAGAASRLIDKLSSFLADHDILLKDAKEIEAKYIQRLKDVKNLEETIESLKGEAKKSQVETSEFVRKANAEIESQRNKFSEICEKENNLIAADIKKLDERTKALDKK